jgi:signal transduction histidine kinase
MFERSYVAKPNGRGTGLGRARVFGIVRQAGGSVWIDSTRERGTTVSVWLLGVLAGAGSREEEQSSSREP